MAELVVIEGQDIGKSFQINSSVSTIGLDKGNTISLTDRRVAPRQAEIRLEGEMFYIKNLSAKKSLLINGDPVKKTELQHGDMISLGDTTFLFSEDDPSKTNPLHPAVQTLVVSDQADTSIHLAKSTQDLDSVLLDLSDDPKERRISTLYRVSHAINSTLDMSQLLNNLLDILFGEFPMVDRGVILLFNEELNKFIPVASKVKDHIDDEEITVSKTILRAAYENREAVISNDAMSDERFNMGMSIAEQNIRSVMCVPLISQEKVIHSEENVIGFIHLDSATSGQQFNEEHLNFLTALAMQAAMALSHAYIHQKNKDYTQKLKDLGKATQELSYHLEKYPIIRSLGKYLFKILNCRRCLLALVKEDKRLVFTPYVVKSRSAKWDETQLNLIRELCEKVIVNNSPLLISDLTFDPSIYFEEHDEEQKTDSFLIVPIPSKSDEVEKENQAVGAICISEKLSGGKFTHEDQELLSILANQVGIALANADLYEQATVDSLTRLFVRRYFFQRLEKEIKRSLHYNKPLSLIMMDLDHFKVKNDTYGHQAGDYVLRETGKLLKKNVRAEHVVARYGGEEFAVILRDTPPRIAKKIGERIRKAIESHQFVFESVDIPCTVSVGLSTIRAGDDMDSLIKRADEALYEAKEGGRNQVVAG